MALLERNWVVLEILVVILPDVCTAHNENTTSTHTTLNLPMLHLHYVFLDIANFHYKRSILILLHLPLSESLLDVGVHMLTTAWKMFLLPSHLSDRNEGKLALFDSIKIIVFITI